MVGEKLSDAWRVQLPGLVFIDLWEDSGMPAFKQLYFRVCLCGQPGKIGLLLISVLNMVWLLHFREV